MTEFADIRIVDIDQRRSERVDPNKGMFRVYFKLSDEVMPVWEKLFELERQYARHSLWRKARTDGKFIIIECPLSEIELHKADLDEDVKNTNAAYRKHLGTTLLREAKEAGKGKTDGGLVAQARKRLFGKG